MLNVFKYSYFLICKTIFFMKAKIAILSRVVIYHKKESYKVLVTWACPTLCDPMDCSLPSSSVHGILQARILEWVVIPFSRGSSWPRDWTWVFHIISRFFTIWATRGAIYPINKKSERVGKSCLFQEENHSVYWFAFSHCNPVASEGHVRQQPRRLMCHSNNAYKLTWMIIARPT